MATAVTTQADAKRVVDEAIQAGRAQAAEGVGAASGEANAERFARYDAALARADKQEYKPGQRFIRLARASIGCGYDPEKTLARLSKWGDKEMVRDLEKYYSGLAERSIQISSPDGSSLAVPEDFSNDLIPMLYAYSVLAQIDLRHVAMPHGTLNFPRISAATSSFWGQPVGNNKQASDPKLGRLTLQEKSLTCVVPVPNRLLDMPGIDADMWIANDIFASMGTNLDKAFIVGTGDEWQPLGVLNYPTTSIVLTDGTRPGNAINIHQQGSFDWTWPVSMIQTHFNANGTFIRPCFLGSVNLWAKLMTATTGSAGFLAWMASLSQGKLLDINFQKSVYIPTASNITQGMLFDANEIFMATVNNMRVAKSTDAAYYDSNGTLVGSFPNNETVTRVIWSGDIGIRQGRSVTLDNDIDIS